MSQHPQRELFKDRFVHLFCQLWKLKQVVSGSISRAVYSTLPLSSTDFNETNPVRPGFQVCCELRLMNPIGAGPADWGGPNRPSLAFKSACCEFPLIKPIGAGLKASEPSRQQHEFDQVHLSHHHKHHFRMRSRTQRNDQLIHSCKRTVELLSTAPALTNLIASSLNLH